VDNALAFGLRIILPSAVTVLPLLQCRYTLTYTHAHTLKFGFTAVILIISTEIWDSQRAYVCGSVCGYGWMCGCGGWWYEWV